MGPAEIQMLERALNDLIRLWERFFAGDLRLPPQTERDRLARRLRHLSENPSNRAAERFRVEQLQQRFATYSQNWERMLREMEEGRGRWAKVGAERGDAGAGGSVDSTEGPGGGVYDDFVAARMALGQEVRLDRSAFEAQLRAQQAQLEKKLGHGIRFEVKVEGGRVKLAARRSGGTGSGE